MAQPSDDISQTLNIGGGQPRWRWAKYGVVAVLAGALVAYWWSASSRVSGPEYVTATAQTGSFAVLVTATGTVEPTHLVEVSSELSGTLARVLVDYNDAVKVGTVLAELDTVKLEAQLAVRKAALDAAIARVAMAQASLDEAQEKFQTSQRLEARGVTSHQDFISRRATFVRAQAELQSAGADRALAAANLDLQQAELDKACICSPINGVVLDRAVDSGQIVASALSAPVLFTVAEDLTQMELRVDVDEADIGQIKVGNAAQFTVDAYDDARFPAEIAEIRFAPETIDGVVTYKAVLSIDNSNLLLRPGMTATADITVAELRDVLTVPNAALRYAPPLLVQQDKERAGLLGMLIPSGSDGAPRGNTKSLWVLKEGVAREVAVQAGASDGRVTQISGGALAVGDQVVTEQVDG